MLHLRSLTDSVQVFKALGSKLRIQIINLLLENKEMSMNEISTALCITPGALTEHIHKLSAAGIIKTVNRHTLRGNHKFCRIIVDRIVVDIVSMPRDENINSYSVDIPISSYCDFSVLPTCGLATQRRLVGKVDDPRFFAHPEHMNARILWFGSGFVDYRIPNMLPDNCVVDKITISFEISSEAPGTNSNWPSDISFYLNDVKLGIWTSPGDFGDIRGIYAPSWWFPNWNQYGLLKMLMIDRNETTIDGLHISDVSTSQLHIDANDNMRLRFAVETDSNHVGGLTLFGQGFGNYNQEIKVTVLYQTNINNSIEK